MNKLFLCCRAPSCLYFRSWRCLNCKLPGIWSRLPLRRLFGIHLNFIFPVTFNWHRRRFQLSRIDVKGLVDWFQGHGFDIPLFLRFSDLSHPLCSGMVESITKRFARGKYKIERSLRWMAWFDTISAVKSKKGCESFTCVIYWVKDFQDPTEPYQSPECTLWTKYNYNTRNLQNILFFPTFTFSG